MFMFTLLIWNKFWRVLIKDSTAVRINDALCLKESKVTSQKGLCDTEINFFRDCTCGLDSSLWSLQYSPFTHRVYREEVLCSPNTCIWKKLGIYQYSKRSYLDRHCYERCRAETSSKCACYPTQTSNGAVHFLLLIIDLSCRFSFKSSCLLVPSDCQRSEKACMEIELALSRQLPPTTRR